MSTTPTNIAIWSDLRCPFCWIGTKNLLTALNQLNIGTPAAQEAAGVNIKFNTFYLDPNVPMKFDVEPNYYAYLAQKKGWSLEQCKNIHQGLLQTGHAAGCEFLFDKIHVANSIRAHAIVKLAETKSTKHNIGLQVQLKLFEAYFRDGVNMNNETELLNHLDLPGLFDITVTEQEVINVCSDKTHPIHKQMDAEYNTACMSGISGVPHFVVNGKLQVGGAQPVESFKNAILRAAPHLATFKSATNTCVNDENQEIGTCSVDGVCQ